MKTVLASRKFLFDIGRLQMEVESHEANETKKSQPVVFFNFLQKTALKEKDAAGLASHRHVVPLNISLTLNLQGKKTFFLVIKNTVLCILTK